MRPLLCRQPVVVQHTTACVGRVQLARLPTQTSMQPQWCALSCRSPRLPEQPLGCAFVVILQVTTPDDMSVAERFLEEAAAAARAAGLPGAPPLPSRLCCLPRPLPCRINPCPGKRPASCPAFQCRNASGCHIGLVPLCLHSKTLVCSLLFCSRAGACAALALPLPLCRPAGQFLQPTPTLVLFLLSLQTRWSRRASSTAKAWTPLPRSARCLTSEAPPFHPIERSLHVGRGEGVAAGCSGCGLERLLDLSPGPPPPSAHVARCLL